MASGNKMKNYFFLSLVLSFFLSFSQCVIAAPAALPVPAFDASQVGVAAAVKGNVKIGKPSAVGRDVKSGEPIFLGDSISTDANSNLQILLLDQTVFTIGANSTIVIDKFVYDPATSDGALNAKVVKGVFRFVTGKIGHKDPKKVNIDLPSGTIGIRGTMVAGKTDGMKSLIILLGPGDKNNTASRRGAIVITNKGIRVDIVRAGFGSEIDGDNPPTEPFLVPASQLSELNTGVGDQGSSGGTDSSNSGDSATRQSGQDTAGAISDVKNTQDNNTVFTKFDQESDRAAQESSEEELSDDFGGFDDITRFGQLTKLSGGILKFGQDNVPIYNFDSGTVDGHYSIDFEINIGSRTLGGGDSRVSGDFQTHNFDFNLPGESFAGDEEFAIYTHTASGSAEGAFTNGEVTVGVIARNSEGIIAPNVFHSVGVDVTDGNGTVLESGAGAGVARQGTFSTDHQIT